MKIPDIVKIPKIPWYWRRYHDGCSFGLSGTHREVVISCRSLGGRWERGGYEVTLEWKFR